MKSVFYNGVEKAVYNENKLKFLNQEDEAIFGEYFENNNKIVREEQEDGTVLLNEVELSLSEKLIHLKKLGFSFTEDVGTELKSSSNDSVIEQTVEEYYKDLGVALDKVLK